MKIRSVTCFINPGFPLQEKKIARAGEAARGAVEAYWNEGYEVQTTRLATIPFPTLFAGLSTGELIAAAQHLESIALKEGFNYVALGPALIDHPESYTQIPQIIAETENVFCSAEMATGSQGISLEAVKACARIIAQLAPQDKKGFANLYFTALSNVPPGSPFFPAAYHHGEQPGFALALEAASLAVHAFEQADTLTDGLAMLLKLVEDHGQKLARIGEKIQKKSKIEFRGTDFSLAPFPSRDRSLGTAMELLGVPHVGQHGSLAAAAMLASTLDQADFYRVGFSGLLFPQLEDSVLALRAEEGYLTVKDMLMYSAVCGTGLDTIPLPGDTSEVELSALLLDLAALGLRLDKPLTARLMPIPGKHAGEPTDFDFDFFANSNVMPLASAGLHSMLAGADRIKIRPLGGKGLD
ncbi:MAG: DUF711 family protein [Chloroflexota bacterium]